MIGQGYGNRNDVFMCRVGGASLFSLSSACSESMVSGCHVQSATVLFHCARVFSGGDRPK